MDIAYADVEQVSAELSGETVPPLRPSQPVGEPPVAGRSGAPPRGPVRVMMYSHDGVGLGHTRRNANIASQLVKTMPGVGVLLLGGTLPGSLFDVPAGIDSLKLPSVVKVGTNRWEPRALHVGSSTLHDLRSHLIQGAAERFAPHLFVVDHMPAGVWGELIPTLKMFRSLPAPPKVILGLRDILDSPEVVQDQWRRDGIHELIEAYYDGVLIYGSEAVYDTAARYGLNLPGKVHYCGYVCAEEPCQSPAQVRDALNLRGRNLVLVTAGGGSDAYPMMEACMNALLGMGCSPETEAVFVTGPLMDGRQRQRLEDLSQSHPIRVIDAVTNPLSVMNAADFVITMGGYNTMLEAIGLRKRVLVIPRDGPSTEQRTRAALFARMGLIRTAGMDDIAPLRLAGIIREGLDSSSVPPMRLRTDGAKTAVECMQRELGLPGAAIPAVPGDRAAGLQQAL